MSSFNVEEKIRILDDAINLKAKKKGGQKQKPAHKIVKRRLRRQLSLWNLGTVRTRHADIAADWFPTWFKYTQPGSKFTAPDNFGCGRNSAKQLVDQVPQLEVVRMMVCRYGHTDWWPNLPNVKQFFLKRDETLKDRAANVADLESGLLKKEECEILLKEMARFVANHFDVGRRPMGKQRQIQEYISWSTRKWEIEQERKGCPKDVAETLIHKIATAPLAATLRNAWKAGVEEVNEALDLKGSGMDLDPTRMPERGHEDVRRFVENFVGADIHDALGDIVPEITMEPPYKLQAGLTPARKKEAKNRYATESRRTRGCLLLPMLNLEDLLLPANLISFLYYRTIAAPFNFTAKDYAATHIGRQTRLLRGVCSPGITVNLTGPDVPALEKYYQYVKQLEDVEARSNSTNQMYPSYKNNPMWVFLDKGMREFCLSSWYQIGEAHPNMFVREEMKARSQHAADVPEVTKAESDKMEYHVPGQKECNGLHSSGNAYIILLAQSYIYAFIEKLLASLEEQIKSDGAFQQHLKAKNISLEEGQIGTPWEPLAVEGARGQAILIQNQQYQQWLLGGLSGTDYKVSFSELWNSWHMIITGELQDAKDGLHKLFNEPEHFWSLFRLERQHHYAILPQGRMDGSPIGAIDQNVKSSRWDLWYDVASNVFRTGIMNFVMWKDIFYQYERIFNEVDAIKREEYPDNPHYYRYMLRGIDFTDILKPLLRGLTNSVREYFLGLVYQLISRGKYVASPQMRKFFYCVSEKAVVLGEDGKLRKTVVDFPTLYVQPSDEISKLSENELKAIKIFYKILGNPLAVNAMTMKRLINAVQILSVETGDDESDVLFGPVVTAIVGMMQVLAKLADYLEDVYSTTPRMELKDLFVEEEEEVKTADSLDWIGDNEDKGKSKKNKGKNKGKNKAGPEIMNDNDSDDDGNERPKTEQGDEEEAKKRKKALLAELNEFDTSRDSLRWQTTRWGADPYAFPLSQRLDNFDFENWSTIEAKRYWRLYDWIDYKSMQAAGRKKSRILEKKDREIKVVLKQLGRSLFNHLDNLTCENEPLQNKEPGENLKSLLKKRGVPWEQAQFTRAPQVRLMQKSLSVELMRHVAMTDREFQMGQEIDELDEPVGPHIPDRGASKTNTATAGSQGNGGDVEMTDVPAEQAEEIRNGEEMEVDEEGAGEEEEEDEEEDEDIAQVNQLQQQAQAQQAEQANRPERVAIHRERWKVLGRIFGENSSAISWSDFTAALTSLGYDHLPTQVGSGCKFLRTDLVKWPADDATLGLSGAGSLNFHQAHQKKSMDKYKIVALSKTLKRRGITWPLIQMFYKPRGVGEPENQPGNQGE